MENVQTYFTTWKTITIALMRNETALKLHKQASLSEFRFHPGRQWYQIQHVVEDNQAQGKRQSYEQVQFHVEHFRDVFSFARETLHQVRSAVFVATELRAGTGHALVVRQVAEDVDVDRQLIQRQRSVPRGETDRSGGEPMGQIPQAPDAARGDDEGAQRHVENGDGGDDGTLDHHEGRDGQLLGSYVTGPEGEGHVDPGGEVQLQNRGEDRDGDGGGDRAQGEAQDGVGGEESGPAVQTFALFLIVSQPETGN